MKKTLKNYENVIFYGLEICLYIFLKKNIQNIDNIFYRRYFGESHIFCLQKNTILKH